MKATTIVQRTIEDKWKAKAQVNTPLHKASNILPPGQWQRFDPFLLMQEDNMKKGVFDHHPHRGIETVSYLIDGELHHKDNKGHEGILHKGDTQWMTAGKGLLHVEEAPEEGFAHLLQLWVNLPAADKMTESRYQDILVANTPVREEDGVLYRVISGSSGSVKASTKNYAKVTMVEITIEKGRTATQDFAADYNGFVFVLQGNGVFGANEVAAGKSEVLWMKPSGEEGSEINIQASEDLKVLVFAGKPLREAVVAYGPFVMNTEEQIRQAYKDVKEGGFGEWVD